MDTNRLISDLMKEGGFTHLQIVCCEVVQKPLRTLPARTLDQSIAQLAPRLVCGKCGKPASPGRVGLWKHGMKRYG